MSECRGYARSLINNLSLLSKLVLTPTEVQLKSICRHLKNLRDKGFVLDDMNQLINGSDRLNRDPDFRELKHLISKINIKTH